MDVQRAASTLLEDACVLFLGSGVSIPAPSSQPSAARVVSGFIREFASGLLADADTDRLLNRWPLPEYFYGVCERYFGDGVYDVWSSLTFWPDHGSLSANAGHLAAVHACVRTGQPILTPNFDNLLESAAAALGVPVIRSVASPEEPFAAPAPKAGELHLWKLHGTVERPRSLFSSVRTLTSPVVGLADALESVTRSRARLILAGYSGRDLDLFPTLSASGMEKSPVWIDLGFTPEHRSRFMNSKPTRVLGSFNDVAFAYAQLVGGELLDRVMDAQRRASEGDYAADREALVQRVDKHTRTVAWRFADPHRRRLVLADVLINAGMARRADALLAASPFPAPLRVEGARLSAKAQWEQGRYIDSRRTASVAREDTAGEETAVLDFAISVAELREVIPPRGFATVKPVRRVMLAIRALRETRLLIRHRHTYRHARALQEPLRTPFVEGFLEHGIRILLTWQLVATRPGKGVPTPVTRALRRLWLRLFYACRNAGYAEGIGNCARYLARIGGSVPGVRGVHEFLGHTLGVAIAMRDAAERVATSDRSAAIRQLEELVAFSEQIDDPTFRLTLVRLGRELAVPIPVDSLRIAQIQARWSSDIRLFVAQQAEPTRHA